MMEEFRSREIGCLGAWFGGSSRSTSLTHVTSQATGNRLMHLHMQTPVSAASGSRVLTRAYITEGCTS